MLSGDLRYLEILKRTYPKIKKFSLEIGIQTYKNMFEVDLEIKNLFKNTPPEQAQRLIETALLYCEKIDNFNLIFDRLDKIAHIHIQHGVKNSYYPVMEKAFVKALCDTLDIDETDQLVQAWSYGLGKLSQELMHAENLIRKYSATDVPFET
ncbi:MAG: globin domain-containing protein [Gammaproteobacteria bacterium]